MLEQLLVTLIVLFSLLCLAGAFGLAMLTQHLERKRQPPPQTPEWLQGLAHEQLRELLQAKRHKTQAELTAMAESMRRLNAAQHRSSLGDAQPTPFDDDGLEVA